MDLSTPSTAQLTARQQHLVRVAAGNRGLIHIGQVDRKVADALVRCGVLSPGSGIYGHDARHLTAHGWRTLAALGLTPIQPEED